MLGVSSVWESIYFANERNICTDNQSISRLEHTSSILQIWGIAISALFKASQYYCMTFLFCARANERFMCCRKLCWISCCFICVYNMHKLGYFAIPVFYLYAYTKKTLEMRFHVISSCCISCFQTLAICMCLMPIVWLFIS